GSVAALTLAIGLILSILGHEVAHIAVLGLLGDHTAEHAGSHSLNPLHHVDAVKTVFWPAVTMAASIGLFGFPLLFGSAQPVDSDFSTLRGVFTGRRSTRNAAWVALAGPLTNLVLAGLAYGAALALPAGGLAAGVAWSLGHMNLALAAFNMLPLPWLDGGKI